ncbi:hypothetical protein JVU11DRAFT_30 [Chiua virens]|nr:hypothetical protein JVU11DRAFT_30 [Chiua virens]
MAPLVPCRCKSHNCKGALVTPATKRTHQRNDLRLSTVTSQMIHRGIVNPHLSAKNPSLTPQGPILPPILRFPDPPATSSCLVEQEMLDHGTLTQEDIDIQVHGSDLPNLGPNFHSPEALLDAVDYYTQYNAITTMGARPLNSYHAHRPPSVDPEDRLIERELQKLTEEASRDPHQLDDEDDDPQEPADLYDENIIELDDDSETIPQVPIITDEDNPDPFETTVDSIQHTSHKEHFIASQPPHLVVIYALATWLHLQFHLPRIACNAFLAIISCLLAVLCPDLAQPLVTLQSATCVLGLDSPSVMLPVCPGCREVYPPASSPHTRDICTTCNLNLFLPDKTQRGNDRTKKTPFVKYPYLPLSQQLHFLLAIPGLEDTLDSWRAKLRVQGQYMDIFDGDICRSKLKAPNGSLFFSNGPNESKGPNGELRIGINLGLDWFSYIRSNIAPSHSSCPVSFSICNLPPEYR